MHARQISESGTPSPEVLVPDLLFLRASEATPIVPKTKNKLHLDLRIGEDDVDTVVAKLTDRGATFLSTGEHLVGCSLRVPDQRCSASAGAALRD
jgi:Glyoxalase-like domain